MTPEQFEAVIAQVAAGRSAIKAAEEAGLHRMQFYRALDADAALRDRYARAKEAGLQVWADQINDIADDVPPDGASVAKARLQVDSRKWLLAKLAPKKYGDNINVEHGGTVNVTIKRFAKEPNGDA